MRLREPVWESSVGDIRKEVASYKGRITSVSDGTSINLRMDKGTSTKERSARVEQVLQELGLRKCENTRIGVPGRVKGRRHSFT